MELPTSPTFSSIPTIVVINATHAQILGLPWPLPSVEQQAKDGWCVRYVKSEPMPVSAAGE